MDHLSIMFYCMWLCRSVGDVEANENIALEEMPTQDLNRMSGLAAHYNSNVRGDTQGVPQHIVSGQTRPGNVYANSQQQKQVNYRGKNTSIRRSQEGRRNFLWGLVAGGLSMLGITVAGRAILSHPFGEMKPQLLSHQPRPPELKFNQLQPQGQLQRRQLVPRQSHR